MILLLDVGNSSIKWGVLTDGTVVPKGSFRHHGGDLVTAMREHWLSLARPERVLVSNVGGPAVAECLETWTKSTWDVRCEFVIPPQAGWGVANAYVEPERLGADRWAALVAVRSQGLVPACIVDCGTAITIDALAATGEHLGGLIIPGVSMMRHALFENTRGIPNEGDGAVALLARSTRDAVTGGTLYAAVAVIDRVTADIAAELREPITAIITGGDAQRVTPLLAANFRHEPALVLEGLAIMAKCDS
jgi:type III pantothenate kinase